MYPVGLLGHLETPPWDTKLSTVPKNSVYITKIKIWIHYTYRLPVAKTFSWIMLDVAVKLCAWKKWGHLKTLSGHLETDLGHIETASQDAPPWLTSHLISYFLCGVYLKQTIIHKLKSDNTGVRYHQNHRGIKYYVIYRRKYWWSQKSTFYVKNGPKLTCMPRMSNSH